MRSSAARATTSPNPPPCAPAPRHASCSERHHNPFQVGATGPHAPERGAGAFFAFRGLTLATKGTRSTAAKSARKSAPGRPFQKGSDPRRGRGPEPGAPNAGRPPEAFKALCRQYASGALTERGIGKILENTDHPQYMAALRWVAEHGYGKPAQPVTLDATDKLADALAAARRRVSAAR